MINENVYRQKLNEIKKKKTVSDIDNNNIVIDSRFEFLKFRLDFA